MQVVLATAGGSAGLYMYVTYARERMNSASVKRYTENMTPQQKAAAAMGLPIGTYFA